jgi:hypothetical protein
MKFRLYGNILGNLYSSKLENDEEIDKFLHIYDSLKLNQEDSNNLNRSKTDNEIETVIKNLPKRKAHVLMDLLLNYTRLQEN